MTFYKGIRSKTLRNLLNLANFWDQGNITLSNEITRLDSEKVSTYLGCSPDIARYYLRTLYLVVNHLVDRKPLTSFNTIRIKTLATLLKLTNLLIKGKIQLNNHQHKEQYLFLREIIKLLDVPTVATERTAWNHYKTLLQLAWMITEKFKSEDDNGFMDYFSSAS